MTSDRFESELRALRSQVSSLAEKHHHPILGTSWSSFGALLIVVGAVLLLAEATAGPPGITGMTFGGTQPRPKGRLLNAAAVVGSLLVLAGSVVLVVLAGVSLLALAVVILFVALLIVGVMTAYLRQHMNLVAMEQPDEPRRSWWWCLHNLRWRPDDRR
jgi:hypothetical protein